MLDKSLFVSDEIHEREVELADGKKHKIWIKEILAEEYQRYAIAIHSDDESERIDSFPRLIAAALVTPDGKPAITVEQARLLKSQPMSAIKRAIEEVTIGLPKKAQTGASGTS